MILGYRASDNSANSAGSHIPPGRSSSGSTHHSISYWALVALLLRDDIKDAVVACGTERLGLGSGNDGRQGQDEATRGEDRDLHGVVWRGGGGVVVFFLSLSAFRFTCTIEGTQGEKSRGEEVGGRKVC